MEQQRQLMAAAKGIPGSDGRLVVRVRGVVDICRLLRLRNRMRQQLHEWKTTTHADQICHLQHICRRLHRKGGKKYLEKYMEELQITYQNRTFTLQRIQLGFLLKNRVKQRSQVPRLIIEHINRISVLSWATFEYQQQARENECKLMDIKMKRLSLKKIGEQKLLQISTEIKKKERERLVIASKTLDTMHHNVQKERHRITLLQNVFQCILIGSKVNWARDTSLKGIALQLEKNVCSM